MGLYDIAKDFQTTLAAIVALTAATIAYRAAMAKLAFDRVEAEQKRRTKIGLVSSRSIHGLEL
jgi:hypothetical protein